jgi:hypothetical protein
MTNEIRLSVSMGIQCNPTSPERIIAMTDLLSSKNYRRSGTDVGEVEDGGGSKMDWGEEWIYHVDKFAPRMGVK